MRVTLDLSEARSFELAEPGPYEMTVDTISEPIKSEKSIGVDVEFKFADPKLDQQCGTVRRRYPITGKGAGFFREFWKAATGQDLPVGEQIDVDLDDAISRPVMVEIGHREYEGRTYNDATRVVGL